MDLATKSLPKWAQDYVINKPKGNDWGPWVVRYFGRAIETIPAALLALANFGYQYNAYDAVVTRLGVEKNPTKSYVYIGDPNKCNWPTTICLRTGRLIQGAVLSPFSLLAALYQGARGLFSTSSNSAQGGYDSGDDL